MKSEQELRERLGERLHTGTTCDRNGTRRKAMIRQEVETLRWVLDLDDDVVLCGCGKIRPPEDDPENDWPFADMCRECAGDDWLWDVPSEAYYERREQQPGRQPP